MNGDGNKVTIRHQGFKRLDGGGGLRRRWRFTEKGMVLTDDLEGGGRHRVTRRFLTPLEAEPGAGGIVLTGGRRTFHLDAPDSSATVTETMLWRAYGDGRPGRVIEYAEDASLPWSGEIRLTVI